MAVINRIAKDRTKWRRHLHATPEPGLECRKTAAFMAEKLRNFKGRVVSIFQPAETA